MTIGIIGYGRFGQIWAKELKKFGQVKIFDQDNKYSTSNIKKVCTADILFLCVPISQIKNISKKIAPILTQKTLVLDVCSVKVYPVRVLKKYLPKNQPIIATHPLLGPDSVKKSGGFMNHKIVVCPIRTSVHQKKNILCIFKKIGLKIIVTSPENHDRQMANSQGLIHFIGRGIENLNLKPQELYTPDYLSLLHIKDMVVHDTWQLFFDMEKYNPYTKNIRIKFLNRLLKLEKKIYEK